MAKFTAALLATLLAGSSAFVSQQPAASSSALKASEGVWDPMGFLELGSGEAFDTFPGMFPNEQFLREAEIKHGRQAMLAWTGVWATSKDPFGLAMHFPGAPECDDWTTALGCFAKSDPATFGAILATIAFCEGESVGHSGDNFKGLSTKTPGNLNFDYLGLKGKLGEEGVARYADVEIKNGRAAMIAMASLFAFKSIPGSVPIMDVLGAH
uniref:Plastid light harvesting protein n=1 Tax=Entomoneis paludosa TaxID=265537 RepID=A0A7S2VDE4_9STRA|mmetsp:Transcript_18041/g.37298  ORF Transcript_18041/g.37298 Transcript_18041/m.37298 type:complete len:211 (+) Transcript_18041:63-695(+)|eukprot:CAMPEP_0172452872 /NCGR_PEP_ID=MMETSP1065-20121228/10400_1 /TAXON_ID=265537 /ORGANISM="Amphiprora paludosa, Strain CCMP125" /LENGTH=210 /DNA_ID=CAMNT_0013205001 /DNA_START=32 /DNA_END=664 /DNA_ORIENTATION=-